MVSRVAPWLALLLVGFVPAQAKYGVPQAPVTAPALRDRPAPPPPSPLERAAQAGHLAPSVRLSTYDARLTPHPLIEEASAALLEGLTPYAARVVLTSLSRAPREQRSLLRQRRYRAFAVPRSKHLMGGFAADVGFVARRVPMARMRQLAEEVLEESLGIEKARLLRVVAETRCLHLELDSVTAREELEVRARNLHRWGIVKAPPDGDNPVPAVTDYVPEAVWRRRPRGRMLLADAG
ncbi:MAG: hypothetical protein ACO3JL_09165 [Myxococcota bacterium]